MEQKGITVAALIAVLQTLPQDAETLTEGCDCFGECSGAVLMTDADAPYVLIARYNGYREDR